jgi:ribosomal protein L11 methyltransferase
MTQQDDNWYRLEILVEEGRSVDATALLWEFDAAGVEVQDRETYADDDTIAPVPEGTHRLVGYYQCATRADAVELEQRIVDELSAADIVPLSIEGAPYDDRTWETAWKDYFVPTQISARVSVGPPWEDFSAPEGGTKIVIEPGMAFGTGTHETTQLCAEAIDRLIAEADSAPSLLDVGCGSAILSMIARRLGAEPVVGIDVDETAVEVAEENLRVNDLTGQVELSTTPVDDLEADFDIVVANILAHILIHIAEPLMARVAPGGRLVLSGIADDQDDDVRLAFVGSDFVEVRSEQRGEWIMIELRREA